MEIKALFDEQFPPLYRYCLRMTGEPDLAQDVAGLEPASGLCESTSPEGDGYLRGSPGQLEHEKEDG